MAGAMLVLVPDEGDSRDIIRLPDGTHELHVEAYWHTTEADGKFQGGVAEFNIELEGSRVHDIHGGPGEDCWCGYVGH